KPVAQNEFFLAGQSGIKASQVLVVSVFDYKDEKKLKFKDKAYSIYRTYERADEKIELYCEVKAGG
ncbi:MAG: phage head closure protein, partial [Bacillus sp. (in: firmicutes)]